VSALVASANWQQQNGKNGNNQPAVKSTSNHADKSSSRKPITLVQ